MMLTISVVFLVLLLLGMPAAFAIGVAGFVFFLVNDTIPISIGVQRVATASQSFPLLAVPFFVLAGNLMNATGITERLIRFATTLAGWIAGGLAHVAIVLSALMGGISGSAVADAAMEARILGPAMLARGYAKGYTAAVIALSSLITATIPPSIGLILYGFLGNVSIGRLFIAGIVPGLLMTLALMVPAYVIARRRGYVAETASRPSLGDVLRGLNESKWALLFPVLLIGGIRFGVFTASEAGAFAVAYAFVIGFLVYRELTWQRVVEAFHQSVSDIGMILLIIFFSAMLGYAIIFEQVPQNLAAFMTGLSESPTVVLLLILLFIALCGMFVESTVLVLLLTPIFVPIVVRFGIDPVHFGILMMTLVTLGSMTPPVGVAMFTVCGLLRCPTEQYVAAAWPFVLAIILLVVVLTFVPGVVLFLPNLLM